MGLFHNNATPLDRLIHEAEDSDNPQGDGFPDGVRESARTELSRRGYNSDQITQIRLGNWKPTYK